MKVFLEPFGRGANKPVTERSVAEEEEENPGTVAYQRESVSLAPLGPSENGPATLNVDVVERTAPERLLALWYVLAACIGAALLLSATGDLDAAFTSFEYMAAQDNTTAAQVCSSLRRTHCAPRPSDGTPALATRPQTVESCRLPARTHRHTPAGRTAPTVVLSSRVDRLDTLPRR